MRRKELHHRILNALGVGAAGAMSLGSACGDCPNEEVTRCIDPDSYRRWVASTVDAAVTIAGGAGGVGAEDDCPTLGEFRAYAKESREVPNGSDHTWLRTGARSIDTPAHLTCCYVGISTKERTSCPGGRPFLVQGSAREATLTTDCGVYGRVAYDDSRTALHDALATAWLRSALTEHASVAAFARLALQLLSVGAPLELIEGANRAALDEIRHAEICLAHANRVACVDHRFGPLDVGGCLDTVTLVELARMNVVEGCIGETLAAAVMAEQAERARDPELRRELRSIAQDESRHAILAWRIARWAIARGGSEVRRAVRLAFAAFRPPVSDATVSPFELEMAALGHLDPQSHALACRSTFTEVILPLALELERPDTRELASRRQDELRELPDAVGRAT
jgi:hypothetical protein